MTRLLILRAFALYLLVTCFATWVGTCDACSRGSHGSCTGSSSNPCDCAKAGHPK